MSSDAVTVVVADDDSLLREAFRISLEARGYNVLLAEDGNHALKIVESTAVDAVLLDILMPRKEGLETLIELKQRFPGLAVFVMSGGGTHNRADFLTIAKKFGADAVLRKPFPIQSVVALLECRDRPAQRVS
jgi:DNA-binding response OmpR family regulator